MATNKTLNEFKPCPFCGNKRLKVYGGIDCAQTGHFGVSCHKCGAYTSQRRTRKGAIAVWNKRAEK